MTKEPNCGDCPRVIVYGFLVVFHFQVLHGICGPWEYVKQNVKMYNFSVLNIFKLC